MSQFCEKITQNVFHPVWEIENPMSTLSTMRNVALEFIWFVIVIGNEQYLCESNLNEIQLHTICMKGKIHEWQFTPLLWFFGEKLINYIVISHEIDEIKGIGNKCNSWHSTDVKRYSVKCWKLISSSNFLQPWIHWTKFEISWINWNKDWWSASEVILETFLS